MIAHDELRCPIIGDSFLNDNRNGYHQITIRRQPAPNVYNPESCIADVIGIGYRYLTYQI